MSMEYIRDYYAVPAKRGTRIVFKWPMEGLLTLGGQQREGTIVGSRNQYLRVRFDDVPGLFTLHPTWEVEYLDGTP